MIAAKLTKVRGKKFDYRQVATGFQVFADEPVVQAAFEPKVVTATPTKGKLVELVLPLNGESAHFLKVHTPAGKLLYIGRGSVVSYEVLEQPVGGAPGEIKIVAPAAYAKRHGLI